VNRGAAAWLIGAVAVAAAGCAPKKPAATAPPDTQPLATGKSSASFVFDPSNPALGLPEDILFDRPRPLDTLTLPIYPDRALAAGDGPHREIVRIIIDNKGHVSEVNDSPLGVSDGGLHAAEFRRVVEDAVRAWRFSPGALRKIVDGNDLDGDGKADYVVTTSWDVVPVYYDVKFTFEIVEGRGVVTKD